MYKEQRQKQMNCHKDLKWRSDRQKGNRLAVSLKRKRKMKKINTKEKFKKNDCEKIKPVCKVL